MANTASFTAEKNNVAWERETLAHLFKLLLSYYLVTALHGRGKGILELAQPAPFVSETIDAVWETRGERVDPLIREIAGDDSAKPTSDYFKRFSTLFSDLVQRNLELIYPEQEDV